MNILSRSEEGYFVKYSATLLDLYKRGECPVLNPFSDLFRVKSCLVETTEAAGKNQQSNLVIS